MTVSSEKYWYGDGDGDQGSNLGKWDYDDSGGGAGSNWRDVVANVGCDKPKDSDIVHIDNRAYYNTSYDRYQDIVSGLTQDLTGHPDLSRFHIKASYNGNVGDLNTYLQLGIPGGDFIFEGTGIVYFSLSDGPSANADCGRLIVNSDGGFLYIESDEKGYDYRGLFAKIITISGTLVAGNTSGREAIIYELYSLGGTTSIGTNCYNEGSEQAMLIYQFGGTIVCDSPLDSVLVVAGTFNWGSVLASAVPDLDCNLLEMYGGTFNWTTLDSDKSILKQFRIFGGILDASLDTNASSPKEIGTGSEVSEIWPSGEVRLDNDNQNITIVGSSSIRCYGGTLVPPTLEGITW